MRKNVRSAILGSFVADSFALGVHWVYDTAAIRKKYGEVDRLLAPGLAPFHAGKKAGEMTHYGDQAFLLLRSLAACNAFDAVEFMTRWRTLLREYGGYVDKASTETLANLDAGRPLLEAGSRSDELGGAARIAPLLALYADDPDALAGAARAQTQLTHDHVKVIEASDFFSEVVTAVLAGETPRAAMQTAVDIPGRFEAIGDLVRSGLESAESNSAEAIVRLGQACPIDGTLPSTVHLIARHTDDFRRAMIDNVMAGGDSATRGLLSGMVLGAHLGPDALPEEWLEGMRRYGEITALLEEIDPT